jgi:hypothetical protein
MFKGFLLCMRRGLACVAPIFVVALALFAVNPVFAGTLTTVYTNLGLGGAFDSASYYPVQWFPVNAGEGEADAAPFTPSATFRLADAILALGTNATTNSPLSIYLESDSGGEPGSILATLTQVDMTPFLLNPGLVLFDCTACPLIDAGTQYWLVATQGTNGVYDGWFLSNSDQGLVAVDLTGIATGPWISFTGSVPAFEVDGTAPTSTTPEPSSLFLLGTGLLGLGPFVRHLKTKRGLCRESRESATINACATDTD